MMDNVFYIEEAKKRLSPERFEHSLNVAKTARHLAQKYGADEEKAYTAGIVHDILKEIPKPQLKEMVIHYCGKKDRLLLVQPSLWHAVAGAFYLQDQLELNDPEIHLAVRYHTTGREGMSLLEKVVFTADFISADRQYPGIEEMRKKAEQSLELAMEEGLNFTIKKLIDARQTIHPDTLDCYNDVCLHRLQKEREASKSIQ